jgi:hypothetical protein
LDWDDANPMIKMSVLCEILITTGNVHCIHTHANILKVLFYRLEWNLLNGSFDL